MSQSVSMQKITCPFCQHKYELDWMALPNSIIECCSDAALRKKIYLANFDDIDFNVKYMIRSVEWYCGEIIAENIYPLCNRLFKNVKIDKDTGKVQITETLKKYYIDHTTIVEGYHPTRIELHVVPRFKLTELNLI